MKPGDGGGRIRPAAAYTAADSISAAWQLETLLGRRYGGSSGTNFVACLQLAADMRERGETGSIVTLLCDRGERYGETLFNEEWLRAHGIDLARARGAIGRLLGGGDQARKRR